MNIFYVSVLCSEIKFKKLFQKGEIKLPQQAQKFHNLLSTGIGKLVENIYIITAQPISHLDTPKRWFLSDKEIEGNKLYYYLPFINIPLIKHIMIFIVAFFTCMIWSIKKTHKEKLIFCDVLNLTISVSALLASKLCGVTSVAIVTDVPIFLANTHKQKSVVISNLYVSICNFFMCKYDSYIVLTEHMNKIVNPKHKPYLVIEGMVDVNMQKVPNTLEDKYKEKVIIYAGALNENNNIKKLIKAFRKLNMHDIELWFFGAGELEEEIRSNEKLDYRIKYFGVVANDVVVKEQLKATLLVNPRPSNEEFTKYSFPSKNMEYMVSGTPVLTTPLPGMPKEYYDYVYIIEDETDEGLTNILEYILSKSKEELHEKGKLARAFVLEEKSNVVQAKKILNLISCDSIPLSKR